MSLPWLKVPGGKNLQSKISRQTPFKKQSKGLSILMKKSLWNASCCVKAWRAMIYYNGRYRHINPGMKMSSPRHFHEKATGKN
jgi:hypothetical protein